MPTFTDKWVKNLTPPDDGRAEHADDGLPGFSLRITASGKRTWAVRYRVRGEKNQIRYTIGPYPAISLQTARERAREILEAAYGGIDLVAKEERERAAADTTARRLGVLAECYLEQYRKNNRPNSIRSCVAEMGHLRDMLGDDADVEAINPADVKDGLRELGERFPTASNRAFSRLRAFCAWAHEAEKISTNPVIQMTTRGMRRQGVLTPEQSRDRVLTDDELKRLLKAAVMEGYPYGHYFRLLALSGQRRAEVQGMAWSEYSHASGDWIIPFARYKTKVQHLVPLPTQARRLLEDIRQMNVRNHPYVFIASRSKDKPISLTSLVDAKDRLSQRSGVTDWDLHDVRRTLRTGLSRLGVDLVTAERVIGHSVGPSIVGVYDLYQYRPQKAEALQTWADYMDGLVAEQ